jgi:beta-glucosidase
MKTTGFHATMALFLSCAFLSPMLRASTVNVDKLVSEMTDEEKVDFIGGINAFDIRPVERLGIPKISTSDGPMGVRAHGETEAYPGGMTLAASWDRQAAFDVGCAMGSEARSKNVRILLAPGVNIYRMPVCGRNFEYLGEDPYLAGQAAASFIKGVQSVGVMACVKHYAANNQEFDRNNCSSDMDERTLHEIYLPAFHTAVVEGHVATVMTSYNLVNGVHSSQNDYLINDILKGSWGFEGFVMSDWTSTYDGLACARAGLDLEMPMAEHMNRETLLPALKSGELPRGVLDDKVRRILRAYERFDVFNNTGWSKDYVQDKAAEKRAALNAARGGMVLLKNDGVLPLDATKIKTVAVIGPNGVVAVTGGGGSSHVDATNPVSLADAVRAVADGNIKVLAEEGIHCDVRLPEGVYDSFDFYHYENGVKKPGVDAEFFGNIDLKGDPILRRVFEKVNFGDGNALWKDPALPLHNFSIRFTGFFTPTESGNYALCVSGDDGYRLFLDGDLKTEAWRNQGETPSRIDAALTKGREYRIVVEYYQAGGGAIVRIGDKKTDAGVSPEEYMRRALEAAGKADLVVMSVGFDGNTESEGTDRTFELPHDEAGLIRKIAAVNPNMVVVLNSGGNVEMESWLGHAKALLEAWYPGTDGNMAAAEILFGKVNPSGKLPATYERALEDNPCYGSYFDSDHDNRVFYKEGIFMGYRAWDKSGKAPRFPFGYGLSYTKFAYSHLATDKPIYTRGEPVVVTLDVKNVGGRDGAEIAEIYVGQENCALPRPVKELKGFDKKFIRTGETTRMSIRLDPSAFAYYDPQKHAWATDAGKFTIYAGASSADIREKLTIELR